MPQQGGGVDAGAVLGAVGTGVGIAATGVKAVLGIVGAGTGTGASVATSAGVGFGSAGASSGAGGAGTAGGAIGGAGAVSGASAGAVAAPVLIVVAVTAIVVAATFLQQASLAWQQQTLAIRRRYRRALFHEENYNNEEVLKRLGKSFTRENVAFAAYDNNPINEYAVRVQTVAAALNTASKGMVLSSGSGGLFRATQAAPQEPAPLLASEWGLLTALHRYIALERLRGFNDVMFNWYTFRGHNVNQGEGLAFDRTAFQAFANEWCNDEPYAPELGYRCGYPYQGLLDIAQANPALLDSARWAYAQGQSKALALASKEGFANIINPGDTNYTLKVQQGCGLSDWIYQGRDELRHPMLPFSVAVVRSRQANGPVLYDLRLASQVPPDQMVAWTLSQAKRLSDA